MVRDPCSEFAYGGEVREMPDPATLHRRRVGRLRVQPQQRAGREARVVVSHASSGIWFIAERDTATRRRAADIHLRAAGRRRAHEASRRAAPVSGSIARSRSAFAFEGRAIRAFQGDTLTSALWPAACRTLGRTFKYHRPRGVLSVANHDVNAMVQAAHAGRSVPNVRADRPADREGLRRSAVNTLGGLERDRAQLLDRCRRSCRSASTTRRFTASACFRTGSGCSAS